MSVFRSLFTWLSGEDNSRKRPSRSRHPRTRLELECLEGRALPSATNGLIVFTSDRDGDHDIYTMNPDGSGVTQLTNDPALEVSPRWSPDGSKIAFVRQAGQSEIFVMNADGSGQTQLTFTAEWEAHPSWSPDGTKIAYQRGFDPELDIFVMNADGTGVTQLTNTPGYDIDATWSPDGSRIVFGSTRDGNNGRELYVMNADGSAQTRLTVSPFSTDNQFPSYSPDGTKIAFTRGTTFFANSYNIHVMNSDGTGITQLTHGPASNSRPAWSPDGARIAYLAFSFPSPADVYVMNADGSGQTNLTNSPSFNDAEPHWKAVTTPLSPEERIEQLQAQVAALPLSGGNRNALDQKLQGAFASLQQGNTQAAINQLRAFANQVRAFVRSGRLTSAAADALLGDVDALIAMLSGS